MSQGRAVSLACAWPGSTEAVVTTSTAHKASNAARFRANVSGDTIRACFQYSRGTWSADVLLHDVCTASARRQIPSTTETQAGEYNQISGPVSPVPH